MLTTRNVSVRLIAAMTGESPERTVRYARASTARARRRAAVILVAYSAAGFALAVLTWAMIVLFVALATAN